MYLCVTSTSNKYYMKIFGNKNTPPVIKKKYTLNHVILSYVQPNGQLGGVIYLPGATLAKE